MRRFVVVIAAIAIAACSGKTSQQSAGATGAQRLRFAVIPKSLDIPVFNYAKIGADRKAIELGNVDILWNAPTNADQLKQKRSSSPTSPSGSTGSRFPPSTATS